MTGDGRMGEKAHVAFPHVESPADADRIVGSSMRKGGLEAFRLHLFSNWALEAFSGGPFLLYFYATYSMCAYKLNSWDCVSILFFIFLFFWSALLPSERSCLM